MIGLILLVSYDFSVSDFGFDYQLDAVVCNRRNCMVFLDVEGREGGIAYYLNLVLYIFASVVVVMAYDCTMGFER